MSLGGLTRPQRYQQLLRSTTLRDFSGGLNVLDDDMNLAVKYAVQSENIFVDNDGTMRVRYGVQLFQNVSGDFGTPGTGIINMFYFNGSLIIVGDNGEVLRLQANHTVNVIWNSLIASLLPGAPAGWSATDFASAAQFNGHLIICNGVDKPIDIDDTFTVEYLQDAGTLTNINVPICRYVVACQRYLIMAGDPLELNRVHISARDAAGTWFGDPPPNDATRLDVGSIVEGANIIRGLLPFRDKLLVLYAEGIVISTLGVYDAAGNHTPDFNDGVKDIGCIAHRSAVTVGDDALFVSLSGVPSLKRTVFNASLKPENASDLVDFLIIQELEGTSIEDLSDKIFSVYDRRVGQYLLVIPKNKAGLPSNTDVVFAYNYRPKLRQEAWSTMSGADIWRFVCGCNTLDNDIFFGDAFGNIYQYGSQSDVFTADDSIPIAWTWETPWIDFGNRDLTKTSKYISFDTRGEGSFTVEMYLDNYGTPSLSTTLDFGGLIYPGTQDKKLFAWPAKFQLAKFIFKGETTPGGQEVDRIVSMTLKYLLGSIRY